MTTLAIFGDVGANENLFAMVFGESVLNDAVAIVLFRTLLGFKHDPVTVAVRADRVVVALHRPQLKSPPVPAAQSVFKGLGMFLFIFIGSFVIGSVVGILATVTLRKGQFRTEPGDDHNALEVSIVVIYPYIAYMLADGLMMSGVRALEIAVPSCDSL